MYAKNYIRIARLKKENTKKRKLQFNKYENRKQFKMLQSAKADENYGKAGPYPDISRQQLEEAMEKKKEELK